MTKFLRIFYIVSLALIILVLLTLFLMTKPLVLNEGQENITSLIDVEDKIIIPEIEPILDNEIEEYVATTSTKVEIEVLPQAEELLKIKSILYSVPFTSQAPFGDWNNEMIQDGCEEAVLLMAMKWVRGGGLTAQEVKDEIVAISNFEQKQYGEFRDASISDTTLLIKDYFKYNNFFIKDDISTDDIVDELLKGSLVIIPVDGRKLNNPYYTLPGPQTHMLLVIGYDVDTDEFITNDPGTKRGANYRYPRAIIELSIQNYATGHHEISSVLEKSMIVISK